MELNSPEEIIDDIRQGKMVILMDDEDRENEGDLVIAAEMVRAEDINFMATHARGLICLTLTQERCKQLKLPLMVQSNGAAFETNFTLSIEAAEGVTTGISAADRAQTIRVAVRANAAAEDIVQPGHIFPLMAQPGGVLRRAGHTEAGCDLARLAGMIPAAAIVEIMNDDGSMARRPDLEKFAEKHQLKIGTIADLIHYRTTNEHTIERTSETLVTTKYGEFNCISYSDSIQNVTHLAFVKGVVDNSQPTLVRVHMRGDELRDMVGLGSEVHWSVDKALAKVASEKSGVVLLLDNGEKEDFAVALERLLVKTSARPAPANYSSSGAYLTVGTGSQILRDLNVGKMKLMSSQIKFNAISGFDLEISEYITCE
ncbi:MAG: GTP cyclohydrolase II / 3,4-dihydroxy-2-butanone 4-phosphate synthase [Osedax symbiont Rs1]|nr:MAG: GTP cyclohydrolase II / 3,4-dihydroxy-2-butanone 4-phosphate synthase [Osedax symbiont Rs1]